MNQSALTPQAGLHVAVIMDGTGAGGPRAGCAHGRPRAGCRGGCAAPWRRRRTSASGRSRSTRSPPTHCAGRRVRCASCCGSSRVTCARRPPTLAARGVRLRVIGRRDGLPAPLVATIARAERRTAGGRALELRIAIDYSARDAIIRAASRLAPGETERAAFARHLGEACRADGAPTWTRRAHGRRARLSDFLLWECAYAELYFHAARVARLRPRGPAAPSPTSAPHATLRRRRRGERRPVQRGARMSPRLDPARDAQRRRSIPRAVAARGARAGAADRDENLLAGGRRSIRCGGRRHHRAPHLRAAGLRAGGLVSRAGRARRPRRPARALCPDEARRTPTRWPSATACSSAAHSRRPSERGALAPRYEATWETAYRDDPPPRRDVLARRSFLATTSLIATRGCHNRCGFCYLATDGLRDENLAASRKCTPRAAELRARVRPAARSRGSR